MYEPGHEHEQDNECLLEQLPYAEIINDDRAIEELMNSETLLDAQRLTQDSHVIREIMGDIYHIIDDSGEQLITVCECVDDADINIENAGEHLTEARKSQASSIILKGTILGAVIGLCIGCPAGAGIGYTIGNATIGGAIIGSISLGGIFGGLSNSIYRKKEK
jgi:hypothetical protein